jgi:hypothetical protein
MLIFRDRDRTRQHGDSLTDFDSVIVRSETEWDARAKCTATWNVVTLYQVPVGAIRNAAVVFIPTPSEWAWILEHVFPRLVPGENLTVFLKP